MLKVSEGRCRPVTDKITGETVETMTANDQTATTPVLVAQGIPSRKLVDWTTPRGELQTRDLESVRDLLRKRKDAQNPMDLTRTPGQMHVRFGQAGQRAALAFMDPGKGVGEMMPLTHHALRAIGSEVLPGRGLGFLLDQVELGEHGRRLSDMSFAAFAQNGTHNTPKMFRTAVMVDPDTKERKRVVRSLHSTDYAPYDNLEFVEDLLTAGYGMLPLVSIRETDQALRFRFL